MGRINYHPARQAVIDHYTAPGTTVPALQISQADGGAPPSHPAYVHAPYDATRPVF